MRPAYLCSGGALKRRLRGDPYHPACNELRRDSRGPNQRRLHRSPMSARFPSTRATRDPPQVRRPNRFGVPRRPKLLGRSKLYRGSRRLPGGPGLPERPKATSRAAFRTVLMDGAEGNTAPPSAQFSFSVGGQGPLSLSRLCGRLGSPLRTLSRPQSAPSLRRYAPGLALLARRRRTLLQRTRTMTYASVSAAAVET